MIDFLKKIKENSFFKKNKDNPTQKKSAEIGLENLESFKLEKIKSPIIHKKLLNENQYIKEKTEKNQIVLHHTAGGDDIDNLLRWWNSNPERIGTHYAIDRKGCIYQLVEDDDWIYHLGIKKNDIISIPDAKNPIDLEKSSIGIELMNWGWVRYENGKYYSYTGREIPSENVIRLEFPYRKYIFFESYTEPQIRSCMELLKFLCDKHNIPISNGISWRNKFNLTREAMQGVPGVYYHTSYRIDKTDLYPHPNLIKELEKLK